MYASLLSVTFLFSHYLATFQPNWFKTNVFVNVSYRWVNGVVPYEMNQSCGFSNEWYIWRAMTVFHRHTCVRFIERQIGDPDWLYFTFEKWGCFSKVGRTGGRQIVNLHPPGCMKIGVILHELMHSIGFFHEHSRRDRDDYIHVYTENILDGRYFKASAEGYLQEGRTIHGRKDSFSENDLAKIRFIYNCTGYRPAPSLYIITFAVVHSSINWRNIYTYVK
ncbi:hypothetical protein RI129_002049 [Pyrocoelia pectoralis]|uniref:Metalloendopeptidase n=1 Tax=Pyrocoelia pectoralis TaxID=417401 RepID=A0AAN7VFY2_9COLE